MMYMVNDIDHIHIFIELKSHIILWKKIQGHLVFLGHQLLEIDLFLQ
jgi:hypothetical protein